MKKYLFIVLLFYTIIAIGQDTTYYNIEWEKVKSPDSVYYYETVKHDAVDPNRAVVKTFLKSGLIYKETYYSAYKKRIIDGKEKVYYENGQLKSDVDYREGKLNGYILTYWESGKAKRIDKYKNDKFIEGKCFSREGNDTTYFKYSEMPEFPGGESELYKFINNNIVYPQLAKETGIMGTVYISFIVTREGKIKRIRLLRGIGGGCDEESLRIINMMPDWKPGKIDGVAASVQYNIPFKFTLN
jgi:periplasmic protein TonB